MRKCRTCKQFKTMKDFQVKNNPLESSGAGNSYYTNRCNKCLELYGNSYTRFKDGKIIVTKQRDKNG
jgi:hypothetical protein